MLSVTQTLDLIMKLMLVEVAFALLTKDFGAKLDGYGNVSACTHVPIQPPDIGHVKATVDGQCADNVLDIWMMNALFATGVWEAQYLIWDLRYDDNSNENKLEAPV